MCVASFQKMLAKQQSQSCPLQVTAQLRRLAGIQDIWETTRRKAASYARPRAEVVVVIAEVVVMVAEVVLVIAEVVVVLAYLVLVMV